MLGGLDCAADAAIVQLWWARLGLTYGSRGAGRIFAAGGLGVGNVVSPAGIVLALLTRCRESAFIPSSVGGGALTCKNRSARSGQGSGPKDDERTLFSERSGEGQSQHTRDRAL